MLPPLANLPHDGLVSFWSFQEAPGEIKRASGAGAYILQERGGSVPIVNDAGGPFGPRALAFGAGPWLEIPRADCPLLDLHGPAAEVSVVAWIKRTRPAPDQAGMCQAVAGFWNEHGLRQYCLFLNLRIHDSAEQVGAHISATGGPSPGQPYCMEAAIGATPVPFETWQCVAITYDSRQACSYLDGRLDTRGERNPYLCPGGIFDGGPHGADFTVGAVARPADVHMVDGRPVEIGHVQSNPFHGLLGGLAVYRRALSATEIQDLASFPADRP